MSEASRATLLQQAHEAATRGEHVRAYGLLTEADEISPLDGPSLGLLAEAAYAAGHFDVTIEAWERVHAASVRAGDQLSAAGAAVRVALHLLFDTALMAPVRGWVRRAERLLEGLDDTPVHAWLAVVRSYEQMLSGDFAQGRWWAERAIELGSRHDPAAAAFGRVAEARNVILDGEIQRGLTLLNEAAVATVSGELDPLFTGVVYCEVVCALQAAAQYDLAEEWTEAMERWRHGQPVGSIHGRCRVHRAEILRLRGSCGEAEQEALLAFEELRPYLRRELGWPLTELGRIRLRTGDLEGAKEAFLAAHEMGWDPQPGLALVQLAEGDAVLAAASIRDALEHPLNVPSKELPPNTELRRAPLLDAQVEIEIACGDLDRARAAAEELTQVAARFESKALAAGATFARGLIALAEGDSTGARRTFEEAVQLWSEVGAPFETALARVGLARAHRAAGSEERATLEFRSARSLFERSGATHQAARAARACAGDGWDEERRNEPSMQELSATESTASGDVLRREGDYWSVTFDGRTVRLRDLQGLRYLARLLAEPGRQYHVLDMVAGAKDERGTEGLDAEARLALASSSDSGQLLDARAKEAYRRRLGEIDEDIEDATAAEDVERVARADAEREFLLRELSRAIGLGGRDRRAGSAAERARASVTRAIRQAMVRIREHHPALGEHLARAIRTGTYCVYLPDSRLTGG